MNETQPADGVRRGLLRLKDRIPPAALGLLLAAAVLPLVLCVARVVALPGSGLQDLPGLATLAAPGVWLNGQLTLAWVPPTDRGGILYILLLPTAALIIALARLTGGIRVLGFRSILIAIGFQEIGLLPSLLLIAIIVAVILVIRPAMRRGGLPLYARVAITLGVVAVTMIGGLLVGTWLNSATLFSFAFFPVVILAMLAESIADTVARSNTRMALWRTGWTIAVAGVIAGVSQISLVQAAVLHAPELLLTEIILVVMLAEFFDLRLLQGVSDEDLGRSTPAARRRPAIALVRNRWNRTVVTHRGVPGPHADRRRSIQRVVDALRDGGYDVRVFEADGDLVRELRRWLPASADGSEAPGLVLNLAFGIQGRGRLAHLPAMLEMAGVPYGGPDPLCMAQLSDRAALLERLRSHCIPVPDWQLLETVADVDDQDFSFPLLARPRFDPDRPAERILNRDELRACVRESLAQLDQPVLAESLPGGREVRACVLGNTRPQVLPLVAVRSRLHDKQCPADIHEDDAEAVRALALRVFRLLGCRDYARLDFRVRGDGRPVLIGIQPLETFARNGSFAHAAAAAGLDYDALLLQVAQIIRERCQGGARRPGANQPLAAPAVQASQTPAREAPGVQREALAAGALPRPGG